MPPRMPRPPTTPGLPKQTRIALREIDDGQLHCTIYRFHAYQFTGEYRPYNPGETTGVRNIVPLLKLEQECMRCGVIATDTFDARTMQRVGVRKYNHPENWMPLGVPKGVKPGVIAQQEAYRRAMQRAGRAAPGQRETAER